MSLKELSKYTITSKYAKYLPEKQRRETWTETVERCRNMHLNKYSFLSSQDLDVITEVFDAVKRKEVAPSMRSLQFGGEAIERKNARMYNCSVAHIYDSRSVEKAFWLLLCGCGVGLGFTKKFANRFPKLINKTSEVLYVYTVPDTIEGWANSVKVLLDSYTEGNEWTGKEIQFDYSEIRDKGKPLSIGGKAPGFEGLKEGHEKIEEVILNRLRQGYNFLRTIDLYDIMMHCSDAVLSGGIRRSATLALFDLDDELMMNAKTGNWWDTNPQRKRSNNSVMLKRDEITEEQFKAIFNKTKQFGEPGFVWVDDENALYNPCAEIGFVPVWNDEPAVQFCNLSIINGTKITTKEDLMNAVVRATIIGTLQAGYTDFDFLDEKDKLITEEEALLGVSILGFMANADILLTDELQKEASALATSVNEEWAKKIGINPAARVTCVKPDGNSAAALESPFSGIHPAHSPKYIRRVQANTDENLYQHFRFYNSYLCEPSLHSATKTDDVIAFPIEVESKGKVIFKKDLSAIEHLEIIKGVQQNWVLGGQKNNKKAVSNSVSCTVLVKEDEWDEVADYIYKNKQYFATVSLLSDTGDKVYPQAPYESMNTQEELEFFQNLSKKFIPVDYTLCVESDDNTARNEELACVGGACAF